MSTNPDGTDTGELDHAALGVSVCGKCESPSMNVIREQHGGFVIRCARCEATLVDSFNPPGVDGEGVESGKPRRTAISRHETVAVAVAAFVAGVGLTLLAPGNPAVSFVVSVPSILQSALNLFTLAGVLAFMYLLFDFFYPDSSAPSRKQREGE